MKKSSSKKEATITIEEVAQLYKHFSFIAKENMEAAAPYKADLLAYAAEHPESFDGNTLKFANGVRVELRESEKPKWDNDAVSYEWVGEAIDADLCDALILSINAKGLPKKPTIEQKILLREIGFKVEQVQTYAVYTGR
jgi:hypothetical protein